MLPVSELKEFNKLFAFPGVIIFLLICDKVSYWLATDRLSETEISFCKVLVSWVQFFSLLELVK